MTDQSRSVPWYRSLRFKLVATAITVEIVMLSILLINNFRLLDKAIESETKTRLEALIPLLDAALAGRVFQRDHTEVTAILDRLTSTQRTELSYIIVLDPAGKVIAWSGMVYPGAPPEEDRRDHSVAEALLGDPTYDVRLPLTIAGNEVGSVRFGLSLASVIATQHQVMQEGGIIAAIEIFLSLLLLATGGYLVTRHIRALTDGTHRVAQGDYSAQILISGHDEIATLASDFNAMAAAVAMHVKELKASEMRFAAIFNAVGEAIFIYDSATSKIIDVNQQMCEMYGYTREEAIGNYSGTFSSGVHPYTVSEAIAKTQAAKAGAPQVFDWHARAKDGRLFWVEVSLRLSRIGDDDRLVAVVRDMSERKKAEDEKNAAIARFQTLVDSLDALVYVADMETHEILFINKYGKEIWGEITGKLCWQTLQAGQSGPCSFCSNDKLLDAGGNSTGTLIWELLNTVTQDWFECRDQAIQWTDGRLVRMEIAINITPRKKAENDLADEREQLAVTLRSIGDGVITTDTQSRVVLLNTVAETLTGWSQQEAQGRPLTEVFNIIHEQTRKPCENPTEKVLVSGEIMGLANHTILIARDGRERKIGDSAAPIRDREGRVIGVVLVFRDVTEKHRLEEELLKVKKLESVGVLAGGIAHDFNNILAAILGNINLALYDSRLGEETRKLLTEAEKASLRAKNLTQQLLTFSKGGEPVKETASIKEIIRDSADFVLRGSTVACRYSIPDDLWLVDIDKGQISQVIQNLIINAKHAMPDGGTIQVDCKNIDSLIPPDIFLPNTSRYIKITISDSGIGIQENLIDKIFDPYFTTKQEGSGLGLAITHSIISKHNGSISVQSKPGTGTTFTLYLPATDRPQEKQQEYQKALATNQGKARIMIMDDDTMVLDVAQAMLTMLGHDVILVGDGTEAIEIYQQQNASGQAIDLIIMDLTIPGGMGGKEAVAEILAINPKAKVIVSSGYSNDPIMARCQEYGFVAAIGKPFQMQELIDTINRIMS